MELKRQGLDPRKDDIVMKFITNPQPVVEEAKIEANEAVEVTESKTDIPVVLGTPTDEVIEVEKEVVETEEKEDNVIETEEEEFARLKTEKAWVNNLKKGRYHELKAKFEN